MTNIVGASLEHFIGLKRVAAQCHATAKQKGWWDKYKTPLDADQIAAKIALIHSELSEGLEEVRVGNPHIYFKHTEETVATVPSGDPKPEGLAIELADAAIRIFDVCEFLGIDIAEAIRIKMQYNETRSHRHGGKAL